MLQSCRMQAGPQVLQQGYREEMRWFPWLLLCRLMDKKEPLNYMPASGIGLSNLESSLESNRWAWENIGGHTLNFLRNIIEIPLKNKVVFNGNINLHLASIKWTLNFTLPLNASWKVPLVKIFYFRGECTAPRTYEILPPSLMGDDAFKKKQFLLPNSAFPLSSWEQLGGWAQQLFWSAWVHDLTTSKSHTPAFSWPQRLPTDTGLSSTGSV